MKETYLSRDFRETAAQCFPSQAKQLNAFFDARLNVLLAENADASKEKQYHLKRQILPGIAAYETLQAGHAERGGSANRSWLCGGAGENEAQTACSPAAHTGALTALSPAFLPNPHGAFSVRRRALTQRSCRSTTVYGVWI